MSESVNNLSESKIHCDQNKNTATATQHSEMEKIVVNRRHAY